MRKNGEETRTVLDGMEIIQRNDFQNFTLDSVLLGDFVKINRKTKKILDIGTGCGVISLILAKKSKAEITGIELQEKMSEVAIRNVNTNNYDKIFSKDEFDVIVTNPPYFDYDGNINQISDLNQISRARHNIDITIEEIVKISAYLLKNNGSFSMIFRSDRLVEVLGLLTKYNLEPKRMKNCYTGKGKNAKLCLVEAIKDAKKGFVIEEAIYVYDENGEKTEYIKKLYGKDI